MMKATIFFVFCVGLAVISAAELSLLKKFIASQEDLNIDLLMELANRPTVLERDQPANFFWKWGVDPNNRLTKFSWSDCGGKDSLVKVNDVRVTPDPVVLPGTVNIAANISSSGDFPDSITADVVMKKRIGPIHIKLPCMGNIGSCHFNDVCDLLSQIAVCPDPLTKHHIPCKCPFQKGNYFLPPSEFPITSASIPRGDYSVELNLKRKGVFMGCLQLDLSVEIEEQEDLF